MRWFGICYKSPNLIVRPVKNITRIFDEIATGQGDFSRDLPTTTHDEFRDLALSYNRFADKMRQIIGEVRKMSVNIAREAILVRKRVGETSIRATHQGTLTEEVFTASNEGTKAISKFRDNLQNKLEEMRKRGVNIMDRNYRRFRKQNRRSSRSPTTMTISVNAKKFWIPRWPA